MPTSQASVAAPDSIKLGDLKISISDLASQGNAILGIRDSGKSYTATWLAEQLIRAKVPIVAFDPIGVWHNLRCAGTGQGFPVIVAGGAHADLPLTTDNAAEIVEIAMEHGHSLVLDLYSVEMSKADWRRIVESSVEKLLYTNKGHGLRHLFFEEAAEFVPQMVSREYGQVYATMEKLVRMGGNAMLGCTLINQRAEQLNKAVLELCDCLFLHRQKGRLSIQALGKWLEFSGARDTKRIQNDLPQLGQGCCYVWAGGEDRPWRVQIPRKATFHPNRRATEAAGARCSVDLSAYADLIGKRFNEYENKRAAKAAGKPIEPIQIKEVTRPVFQDGELAQLALGLERAGEIMRQAEQVAAALNMTMTLLRERLSEADRLSRWSPQTNHIPRPASPADLPRSKHEIRQREVPSAANLGKGALAILRLIVSREPVKFTAGQIGTLCGFTPSTMRTYLPQLRQKELIVEEGGSLVATLNGSRLIGDDREPTPMSPEAILADWCSKLGAGPAKILRILALRDETASTEVIESLSGFTASTVRTYIPLLIRNRLIQKAVGGYRITPELSTA